MKTLNLNIMFWFLALMFVVDAQQFCSIVKPSPTAARAPPFISPSYQAHIEVNILDKNYSMSVDEYLDYEGNQAAMIINKGGKTENLIFSYATNEVFDIIDGNCKIYLIENSPYTFLLGPTNITSRPHIWKAASSLRFTSDNNLMYNGTGTVRGIPADIWSTCLVWPGAVGNIRATYYFSEQGWNTSSPLQQIPLRVEVEGLSPSPQNGPATTNNHFHHIYDFVGYLPYIIDTSPSIFQTPPEVVCMNRTNVRDLPKFTPHFKYRAEIVDSKDSSITHYAVWYDEDSKLVREDTRKNDPSIGNGGAIVSRTEIHDFNTGVRYIMDPTRSCLVESIVPSEADTDQDVSRFQFNGSLVVDIRDPNSFFVLNYNYTYTGSRKVRGITCDIFSTIIPGYVLEDHKFNATFEYAFLADGWNDIPLYSSQLNVQNYPVQLVISIPSVVYTRVYNFFEFSEGVVTYPIFDVSSCFDEAQKLGFQITLPGGFGVGLQAQWTLQAYNTLIKVMQVFPVRLGGITITNDDDNIYINAYVLGPSVAAQFNNTGISLERENDKVIKGIKMFDECAALCVDDKDIICESFQYCQDDGFACRLSKNKQATNRVLMNATACQEYSRRVKVSTVREPVLREAYNSLLNAVHGGDFQIMITDNEGTALAPYTAIDVEVVSGKIVDDKPLPTLPSAFFYRMELVNPKLTSVDEIFIWYDDNLNLVRYDSKDPNSDQQDMLTTIHDYNSGVAFEIKTKTDECREIPIPSSSVFDIVATGSLTNGAIRVTMKTSNALFFLDDTYTYVGQGTARGILCDVFESKRSDFNEDHHNTTSKDTIFKYYFQTDTWKYTSPMATVAALNQPVQLNVEDKTTGEFFTYNFYDFIEQQSATSFYDTSPCYTSQEMKTFVIIFENQPYHPVLDDMSEVFLHNALNKLAQLTFMSPINFQHASLSYDDNDVYFIVTALGHTTPINQFTPVMNVAHNTTDNEIYSNSPSDCASACVFKANFVCNSFDYCYVTSGPNCLLGSQRSETAGDATDGTGICTHFSRTENDTYQELSIEKMYFTVTNSVYDDKFTVAIQLPNGTTVTYMATSVRDDILSPEDINNNAGSSLQKFNVTTGLQLNSFLVTHNAVSVTDCATSCLQENTFDCQAFDYQFTLGTCRLSDIHPDEFNTTNPGVTSNLLTSVYARSYTADYIMYNAAVYDTHPDKTITNVKTDELCARDCTVNTDFVCEAFEICTDGSCLLRRTHTLDAIPTGVTPTSDCVHYSRNHLFDYIRRDNQIIDGHDDSTVEVDDASVCAQLCSSGDGLPSCASFEVCNRQMGVTECTLSTADPTQNGLTYSGSMQCTLYTKANPPISVPGTSTSTKAYSGTGTTTKDTTKTGTSTSTKAYSGTGTSTSTKAYSGTDKQCSAQSDSSSDTGARVGIAFGTLILGLLVGAACMLLFMRFRYGRHGVQEDATVLKTWDN